MEQPHGTLFEVDADGIATLILNEPARMNPITTAIQQGALAALQRVREDPAVRALIVTGQGKAFCVGADLDELAAWSRDGQAGRGANGAASLGETAGDTMVKAVGDSVGDRVGDMMQRAANPIIQQLHELPVPVVCAINGPAVGGGFGFALAGDVVIAAKSAYFYLPFVPALGLVPDMGASWRLPRAVGHARAMGMALLGDRVSAEEAAQWGLIWACVADTDLRAEALRLAQRLAALPAHAALETRALLRAAGGNTLPEQLTYEMQRQRELLNGESFTEGLAAFQAKRKPQFAARRALPDFAKKY